MDTLIVDARVWTPDGFAEAVGIEDGRVAALGTADDLRALAGPDTEVLDLDGAVVLPGFVDAHVHLLDGGLELAECPLGDAATVDDLLATVRACDEATPGRGWLVGSGFDLSLFPDANPTAAALDAVVADRPVVLLAADGHSAWLNARGLREARISAETPDPENGRIERDPEGHPTGTLRETAVDVVWERLPSPTRRERREALRTAVGLAHGYGITAAFEAYADRASLVTFRALDRRGELGLRVSLALPAEPDVGPEQVRRLARWRRRFEGGDLVVSTAKVFADGVLEARTAALLEPYLGGDDRGDLAWDDADLGAVVEALAARGFRVHAHAIGDAAVRQALDAAERAGAHLSVAHLELVDPADVPRFAELSAEAVFSPLWAYEDSYVRDLTVPVIGPERSARLYPIGDVLRAGGRLAFGSDWSVSSLDPLQGIEVAVTRRDPDGADDAPLAPDQAITVEQALEAYTRGAAEAAGLADRAGSLEVGRPADLVVLSGDPFVVEPAALGDLRVVLTMVGGRVVHRAP